jgi:hypothetical protein
MTRTKTISIDHRQIIGKFLEDLARFFVVTDRLPAAYAEMATDSDREAEAVEWLGALPVGTPLDEA